MNRSLLQAVLRRVEAQSANGPRALADGELLRRFADHREEVAFAVLVARHGPLVWAVCRNLLPNETDAEDAFQATFLALIRSAGRIRTPAVGAWLHGVAVRVARMAKRSAARRRQRERKAATTEANTPIANAAWAELQAAVHEEVGRLPDALRAAFVLCNLQGKPQREVAAELGWKAGTLSGRLSKARQQLLDRLAKRGVVTGSVVAAVVAGGAEAIACAPAGLVAKVEDLARAGLNLARVASPTLLELARAATEVTMTRTKLLGLAAAVTGILVVSFTLIPFGSAQDKAGQPPRNAAGAGGGAAPVAGTPVGNGDVGPGSAGSSMGGGRGPAPAWEYKYVIRQSNRLDEFQNVLASHAASGWEYVGTESLQAKTDQGNAAILVFKRSTGANRAMPAMPSGSGGIPSGGLGGFSGFSGAGFSGLGGGPGFGGIGGLGGAPGASPKKPANPIGEGASGAGSAKGGPMGFGSAAPANREYQIVTLKHASATSLAKSLQELFNDAGIRIIAEQQSNSLLIQADRQSFDALAKLLEKLDMPAARRTP